MSLRHDLPNLSREQLCSMISQLRRENSLLKTDLTKYKLESNSYQKYFEYFNEINENFTANYEILDLIKDIKLFISLKQKTSCVSVEKYSENDLNLLNINLSENSEQLGAEEVSDNGSNSVIIDERVNQTIDQNINETHETIKSTENEGNHQLNDISVETNNQFVGNDTQSQELGTNSKSKTQSNSKKLFRCDWEGCSAIVRNLWKHKNRHTDKFLCNVDGCQFRAGNSNHLTKHMRSIHSNNNLFKCWLKDCTQAFRSENELVLHQITCQQIIEKDSNQQIDHKSRSAQKYAFRRMYFCSHNDCTKVFRREESLRFHMAVHKGINLIECEWEGCSKTYSNLHNYLIHMSVHKGIYRCDWEGCQFKCGIKGALDIHKLTKHSSNKPFKCLIDDCNKAYKLKQRLKEHQLREHPLNFPDVQWMSCPQECGFQTKDPVALRHHKYGHNNTIRKKSYICRECYERLPSVSSLKHHMAVHSGAVKRTAPKIACEWPGCERLFSKPWLLKVHMNTHTGETVYSCQWPNCDKTFFNKKSLISHSQRHKGRGRYNCPHCDYGSADKKCYFSHLGKHRNVIFNELFE